METSMSFVKTEIVETLTAIPTSTASPQPPTPVTPTLIPPTPTVIFPVSLDRHDPEAVLRAYFDAWTRNDWVIKNALTFGQAITPEPVDSLEILEFKSISSSPTEYVYSVWFEIQVKGQGISLHSGKYFRKYHLIWVPDHDSWYVTGYTQG